MMPGLANEDFVKWREEKLEYLQSLRQELEYDTKVVAYVEVLEAVKKSQYISSSIVFFLWKLIYFLGKHQKHSWIHS